MKKYFLMVAFAALILGGCTLPNQQQQQPEQPTAPVTPVEPEKPLNRSAAAARNRAAAAERADH
ncbi:PBP1b-binding outer membrane lipoprotein LpoB [Ewingella americana]